MCDISTEPKLPPSCKEILARYPATRSGYYLIQPRDGTSNIYLNCDMENERCGSKGWTRVAHMNMSKTSQPCPVGFTLIESPIRSCGGLATGAGCASVKFCTYGISYSQVCGRLRGYQVGPTNGFGPYQNDPDPDQVIDGILISHGETQEHIWAYAVAYAAVTSLPNQKGSLCPCNPDFNGQVPPFIGNDYYCDSGVENGTAMEAQFYTTPLWTGEGCAPPECCSHSGMPWFCKTHTHY